MELNMRNTRRGFLQAAAAGAASIVLPRSLRAARPSPAGGAAPALAAQDEFSAVRTEIGKRHDEAVRRLQTWIRQPSIAAENRGMEEGCRMMMDMLREAGFD